eukprot:7804257-Karenia_brevis.AAC.1
MLPDQLDHKTAEEEEEVNQFMRPQSTSKAPHLPLASCGTGGVWTCVPGWLKLLALHRHCTSCASVVQEKDCSISSIIKGMSAGMRSIGLHDFSGWSSRPPQQPCVVYSR